VSDNLLLLSNFVSEFVGKHSGAEHITPYVTDEG